MFVPYGVQCAPKQTRTAVSIRHYRIVCAGCVWLGNELKILYVSINLWLLYSAISDRSQTFTKGVRMQGLGQRPPPKVFLHHFQQPRWPLLSRHWNLCLPSKSVSRLADLFRPWGGSCEPHELSAYGPASDAATPTAMSEGQWAKLWKALALHCCRAHARINWKIGNSALCKTVTSENFTSKLCTRDYVGDCNYCANFDVIGSVGFLSK